MKKIFLSLAVAACSVLSAVAVTPDQLTIYLNPGHGGYDSDDRNVVIPPFSQGDPEGYWESKSNLWKGLELYDMMQKRGYKVYISRTQNRTEDDLGLATIGRASNDVNADMFLSMHSNATGTGTRMNRPLTIYKGYTGEPTHPGSEVFAEIVCKQLLTNQATVWTNTDLYVVGDWTFYHHWGDKVGLGVLRQLDHCGMLSEGSFHDYVPEAYRLLNHEFCWAEAYRYLKSFEEYFKVESKETTGNIAGIIYDDKFIRDESYKMFGLDNNMPLIEADVELLDSTGKILQTYKTQTLPNGYYLFKDVAPGKYTVRVSKSTHEVTEVTVDVVQNQICYKNIPVQKIRNTPPEVLAYSPVWKEGDAAVLCNSQIRLEFNWDMDFESTVNAVKIEPAVSADYTWSESNFVLTITPKVPYTPNTKYTVTVGTGAKHAGGKPMAKEFIMSFTTDARNYYPMLSYFPKDGDIINIKSPAVYMTFDKPLDSSSATGGVKVTDATGAELKFSSRGVAAGKASDEFGWIKLPVSKTLTAGQEYTAVIPTTVCDLDGIHLEKDIVSKFTAVNMSVLKDGAQEVEGFENPTQFTVNESACKGYTATLSKDSSSKLIGTAALQAKYTFTEANGGVIAINATPGAIAFTNKDVLEINVNGDMSSNEIFVLLNDGAETVELSLGIVDYYGWQYKQVDLASLKDNANYKFAGLKIAQTGAVQGKKGTLKFDNLVRFENQSGGVEDVEMTTVSVYPNPASEYIIATADGVIDGMELYATDGARVAARGGNVLYVAEMAAGTYVVKVHTAGSVIVEKVVIKH